MPSELYQLVAGVAAAKKGATQVYTINASTTVPTLTVSTLSPQCIAVMLRASVDCFIDILPSDTTIASATTANCHMLPAGSTEVWTARGGKDRVEVLQNSAGGKVWMTELLMPGFPENY